MSASLAVAVAGIFVWLGMVAAISFLEAPLKFRAPGITVSLGLGIGRLVFRALNICECVLGIAILVALFLGVAPLGALAATLVAVATLMLQVLVVRRLLARRSDAVLAGADGPRSHAHYVYIALEVVKVVALLTAGSLLLAA